MEPQAIYRLINKLRSKPILNVETCREFLSAGYFVRIQFGQFFDNLRSYCSSTQIEQKLVRSVIQDIVRQLVIEQTGQRRYFMLVPNHKLSKEDKFHGVRYQSFIQDYWKGQESTSKSSVLSKNHSDQKEENTSEIAIKKEQTVVDNERTSPEFASNLRVQKEQQDCQKSVQSDFQEIIRQYYQDGIITLKQYEVPSFLWTQKRGVGFYRFLSFNVTNGFKSQLKDVVDLLEKQVSQQGSYLQRSIQTFVHSYQYYRAFRQFQSKNLLKSIKISKKSLDATLPANKFSIYEQNEDLWENWKEASQIIAKKIQQVNVSTSWIKENTKQCLKNIAILYTPFIKVDNQCGFSDNNWICVNINFINEGITIDQFKTGPLKPYLYVVILHEMGHMLIRRLQSPKFSDYENSINIKQKTKASIKIWKLLKRYYIRDIKPLFAECKINTFDVSQYQQNTEKMMEQIIQWKREYAKFQDIRQVMRLNFDKVHKIKNSLRCILYLKDNAFLFKSEIYLQKWTAVSHFMSTRKLNQSQDETYRFISALYYAGTMFPSRFLNTKQNKQIIQSIRANKSYHLSEQRGTFDELFKQATGLYNKLNKDHLIQAFNTLFLRRQPFESMLKEMIDAVNELYSSNSFQAIGQSFIQIKTQNFKCIYFMLEGGGQQADKMLDKLKNVIKLYQIYEYLVRKLNLSQLFLVACQIPIDYIQKEFNKVFDSGYQLQNMVFPNLYSTQDSKVFSKDYELMKELDIANAKEIGDPPVTKDPKEQLLFVRTKDAKKCLGLQVGDHCRGKRTRMYTQKDEKQEENRMQKKFKVCTRYD